MSLSLLAVSLNVHCLVVGLGGARRLATDSPAYVVYFVKVT